MSSSVCLKCGHFKRKPLISCQQCGFAPLTPEDMARSLMLSPSFDVGECAIGLSPAELAVAAKQIQAGTAYQFEPRELNRVVALHESARSISGRRLLIDGVRWLFPPLALLALLAWFVFRK